MAALGAATSLPVGPVVSTAGRPRVRLRGRRRASAVPLVSAGALILRVPRHWRLPRRPCFSFSQMLAVEQRRGGLPCPRLLLRLVPSHALAHEQHSVHKQGPTILWRRFRHEHVHGLSHSLPDGVLQQHRPLLFARRAVELAPPPACTCDWLRAQAFLLPRKRLFPLFFPILLLRRFATAEAPFAAVAAPPVGRHSRRYVHHHLSFLRTL
mmetsp:Transcript_12062/g.30600  ORF Transcript_12062/g.30600 Transcript_12062/m.30600 type:complete len:210 (+) Transcript_12062:1358-1987(+)